jgi:HD-like signal output (HDOD) protein
MSDDILEKLRSALLKDGDFPASANVVNKLQELTNDPRTTGQQITEIILSEPSLSTRILHLVNSGMYRRAKPIVTISQAVVAVGMKSIAELCSGMVLLQRFVPLARKSSAFAGCFKRALTTSLLASSFSAEYADSKDGKGNELGYISGFFAEIGTLLLAYYFPKVYELAEQRAKNKNIPWGESLFQITGYTPVDLSSEVIKALGLPQFYIEVLQSSKNSTRLKQKHIKSMEEEKIVIAGKSSLSGTVLSIAIESEDQKQVESVISLLETEYDVPRTVSSKIISDLPVLFQEHCYLSDIPLPPLPDFLKQYSTDNTLSQPQIDGSENTTESNFSGFIDEIKIAVTNREPLASIITLTMEALKFGLGFDRVILMLFDASRKNLVSRMAIGLENFKPGGITRNYSETSNNSYSICIRDGKLVFQGEPINENAWPFVFIPVGNNKKGAGVIYADKTSNDLELNDREKANLTIILDLLNRAVTGVK